MSLHRLITASTALAVTAAVAVIGVVGYLGVRSEMLRALDRRLSASVSPYLRSDHKPAASVAELRAPKAPPFGGPAGYIQVVTGEGAVIPLAGQAASPPLPVGTRTLQAARTRAGRYFSDITVDGVHVRVLTSADRYHPWAVQSARPLTEIDSLLAGILLTFGLLTGSGIVLAVILGGIVGRTALAPIRRFIRDTDNVTGVLDGSQRLEEAGPTELAQLAHSFNHTLEALERSVQAQHHLVSDASHEVRTPIAALRSDIQIFLDSGRLPPSEAVALRERIVAELVDLTRLVDDIVELARGDRPLEQAAVGERVQLDEIVEEAIERIHRRAPHLRFDVSLEPTVIYNMPDSVSRAVANVLDNARKWSPAGGSVEVRLERGTLSVRDHGPGFDDEDLPHVFDRFYRAERARSRPGSGLGLAIVHQAATARGGAVQATNAPGGGALVLLSFEPAIETGTARRSAALAGIARSAPNTES